MSDNWENRSRKMQCKTCIHYCNKRCRRHAPTIQGFPAVYETDWCGDHKMDKEEMNKSYGGYGTVRNNLEDTMVVEESKIGGTESYAERSKKSKIGGTKPKTWLDKIF